MNDWDRNNLHWILDADEDTLNDFYSWATDDDIKYALELVQTAKAELLVLEAELADDVEDTTDACLLLRKFRL